jgi:hypothetical protein
MTVHAIGKSRSVERINKALALLLNAKASLILIQIVKRRGYPAVFLLLLHQ